MSRDCLLALLQSLNPEAHAASPNYARRLRLEWRILCALARKGCIRRLDGRSWTRQQLLEEAYTCKQARLVLVVDNDARGDHDTAV